jgi:hypothetical protein
MMVVMTPNPQTTYRAVGFLYLVPTLLGPFSMMYVPAAIFAPHDAEGTASRLLALESLFRIGIVSDIAIVLSEIALTAVIFVLFRRVHYGLALMATFARLAMTVVQAVNLFPQLAALGFVLDPPSAISSSQAHALAYTLLELHAMGAHLWEPLFALHCVLLGVLVMRSGEVPRALGVGLVIAAFGYGLNGIGHIVVPGLASTFEAIVAVTAIVGEVPFVLWLLFGRVREREATSSTGRDGVVAIGV